MVDDQVLTTGILGVYMLFTLSIGLAGWKILPSTNLEEYILADRSIGWFVGYFSIAGSQFSALTMMGFVAFYYQIGVGAFLAIMVASMFFWAGSYYYLAPRIWKLGRKTGQITPSDLVRDYYDSQLLGYIIAIGLIIALIPYLQLQFSAIGLLLDVATGGLVSYTIGVLIIGTIISIYAWLGGMKSIAWVDAFQGVLLIGSIFFGGILLVFSIGGGFETAFAEIQNQRPELLMISSDPPFNWPYIITFSVGVFFGWIFHPHIWIRIHYFKSGYAVENMPWAVGSLNLFAAVGGWLVMLAGAVALPDAPPDQFLLLMFDEYFSTILFAILCSAILAAIMSTASSLCHGIGTVVSQDISKQLRPTWSEPQHLLTARVVTFVSIIIAILLSFAGVQFLLTSGTAAAALAASLMFPQAVAAIYSWKWPTKEGAIVASIGGSIVTLMLLAVPQISIPVPSVWEGFWGLLVNIILFVSVSQITASHPNESTISAWNRILQQPFATLDSEHREERQLNTSSDD